MSFAKSPSGLAADYLQYDALGLAELIARREFTPLELLHAVRQRVEALNPKLNAFSQLFFEMAETQIKAGVGKGLFAGVPLALKGPSPSTHRNKDHLRKPGLS